MEGLGNRQIVCNMKPRLLIYVVKLQTLTSTVGLKCSAWTGTASRLSTSVSRDLSGSFRIADWYSCWTQPVWFRSRVLFYWVLNSIFFVICVLTGHLRPNIKWMFCGHGSRWYPQVWVGGCGSTQCGNGSVTQCVGGGRNRPKFHRMRAACLNFG